MGLLILLGTGISVVRVWLQGRVVRLKENLWHLGSGGWEGTQSTSLQL